MELAIPTIETERLTLRPFGEEDATALFELSQETDLWGNTVQIYGISRAEWEARSR